MNSDSTSFRVAPKQPCPHAEPVEAVKGEQNSQPHACKDLLTERSLLATSFKLQFLSTGLSSDEYINLC